MQPCRGPGAGNPGQRPAWAEAAAREPWHLQTSVRATGLLRQQGDGVSSRGKLSSQTSQGTVIHSPIQQASVPGAEGMAEDPIDLDCGQDGSLGAQTPAGESDDRHDLRKR